MAYPSWFLEYITSDRLIGVQQKIAGDFSLSDDQYNALLDILSDILHERSTVADLPKKLIGELKVSDDTARQLALRIARDYFWPLQEYYKDIDTLILSLGGTVPPLIPHPSEESSDEAQPTVTISEPANIIEATAREVMDEGQEISELYLTQKPLKDLDDRLKAPTVTNWIKDFLETMGAGGASTLKRSQYLARSRNAAKLNESEKQNLLNFLMSYEEDAPMYWEVAEGQYLMSYQELPSEKKLEIERTESIGRVSDLWDYYKSVQNNIDKQYIEMRPALETEITGNVKRLADIVWDSIGMNHADRCCAALSLLIEKGAFMDMLKTDQRFKGIIARAIDAQYGTAAKNTWNGEVAGPVILTLFWKLVLVEKLGIDEGRASIIADYMSRKNSDRLSPMYLDLKRGLFMFREIVHKDRQLQFA